MEVTWYTSYYKQLSYYSDNSSTIFERIRSMVALDLELLIKVFCYFCISGYICISGILGLTVSPILFWILDKIADW